MNFVLIKTPIHYYDYHLRTLFFRQLVWSPQKLPSKKAIFRKGTLPTLQTTEISSFLSVLHTIEPQKLADHIK